MPNNHVQDTKPTDWELQHAAYVAGIEEGQRQANRVAAEAIARELLQDRANEMLGLARREALHRHGPHWAALIEEASR